LVYYSTTGYPNRPDLVYDPHRSDRHVNDTGNGNALKYRGDTLTMQTVASTGTGVGLRQPSYYLR